VKTKHTEKKCVKVLFQIATVGAAILLLVRPAAADSELVVKFYQCPQGQAAATADSLRNEYGVIPGVRVAADERTSQVIVQAPAELQSRISQRLAAAFPNLQPAADKAAPASAEVREITLKRIQAEQLETALWSTLANRLTALPDQRAASHGYRLTLSNGAAVTILLSPGTKQVKLEGPAAAVNAAARLIQALDSPQDPGGRNVHVMPLQPAQLASVRRAASIVRATNGPPASSLPLAALLMQPRPDAPPAGAAPSPPAAPAPGANPNAPATPGARPGDVGGFSRIVNPVQMDVIEGLDVLVLRGSEQDVEQMMEVVRQIELLSAITEPEIEIAPMKHVGSEAMASLARSLWEEVYAARQGTVSITALMVPNAILIVGRAENVKTVKDLVARLDQPAVPGAQIQVFHLKYASPVAAQTTIQNTFSSTGGTGSLSPTVRVTADSRTSSLIVQASPRDMAAVADLIRQIDVINVEHGAVNEVRIIRLEHTLASEIVQIMQQAVLSSTGGSGQAGQQGQQGQQGGFGQGAFGQGAFGQGGQPGGQGQTTAQTGQRAAMLRFLMVDAKSQTQRLLNSGILNDVHITADARANALVISSPPENLDLLEGLVRQLDNMPAAEAQIKVFTIVNGDAQTLSNMLQQLLTGQPTTGNQQAGGFLPLLLQSAAAGSENTLVPLHFGVDPRTNSVIVSGAAGDLGVVEAILTKLDDSNIRNRKSVVIRLKNSPAQQVANTISTFLTTERTLLQQAGSQLTSAFEQIEREVVVVAEPVTNSLILSSTPKYYDEVRGIIEQLDARPPMVMIQVMIASIDLGSTNEFGIELGLQDSVLFDRSILSNLQSTTNTLASGASTSTVVSANGAPGFNFNTGDPLGNLGNLPASSGATTSTNPQIVGGQGIANFGTSRTNTNLGYSGLVLSAASENISAMLRALSENHRIEILQRPQVMTLDNQPAFIQVGQRVPRITTVTQNATTGNTNSITLDNVGLILGVTPRISPDGLVVMEIDAEKSELESDATGIPIFTSPGGQVVRSPIIDATTAQTVVAAMSDQTIVIGGLITKSTTKEHHGVPVLDDIPVINNFFRYDSTVESKTELLIILTPRIVRNQADAEAIKRTEAAKMTWCMSDVTNIYGEAGLRRRTDVWTDGEVPVIYPDSGPLPASSQPASPETIPTPSSQPAGPARPAAPVPSPVPAPMSSPAPASVPAPAPSPAASSSSIAPMPNDTMSRYGAPQQGPYGAGPQSPSVQPASYQPQPWQQGNMAQPVVYQASVGGQPARPEPTPSLPYQQQASEPAPPAYYPSNQGSVQR
jgi:type II secretion system protein D